MRQLAADINGLIGAMRQTPAGTSERFLLRLQGAIFLKKLEKLGVACKINNDFQKIDQDDVAHRDLNFRVAMTLDSPGGLFSS